MGLFDELKKLTRPYDDEEDEFEDFAPKAPERVPVTPRTAAPKAAAQPTFGAINYGSEKKENNKVVNIHATTQLQVVLVKPERYEDVTSIADHLNDKKTVVLNLESADRELSRRIVDFLSGATYANHGNMRKVSKGTFLIVPYGVDMMGEVMLEEFEDGRMYF